MPKPSKLRDTMIARQSVDEVTLLASANYDVSLSERRRSTRAATVFTIGKLVVNGREQHCMVRDLSEGGMRVQMSNPPKPGTRVLVEMRGLEPTQAWVRWVEGRDCGLAFETEHELGAIFEARTSRAGRVARPPRFTVMHAAKLKLENSAVDVVISDISVGGAKLLTERRLPIGASGTVALGLGDEFDVIGGSIRWVREDSCGFRFVRPLSSVALSRALEAAGPLPE
jgi:hypothetical protein